MKSHRTDPKNTRRHIFHSKESSELAPFLLSELGIRPFPLEWEWSVRYFPLYWKGHSVPTLRRRSSWLNMNPES